MKKTKSGLQSNPTERNVAERNVIASKRILLSTVAASVLASSAIAAPYFGVDANGADISYNSVVTAGNNGYFTVQYVPLGYGDNNVSGNKNHYVRIPESVLVQDWTGFPSTSQQSSWKAIYGGGSNSYNNLVQDLNGSAGYPYLDRNITLGIDQTRSYTVTFGDNSTGVAYNRAVQLGAIGGTKEVNVSTGANFYTVLNGTITLNSNKPDRDTNGYIDSMATDIAALTIKGGNANNSNRSNLRFTNQGAISISNDGNTTAGTYQATDTVTNTSYDYTVTEVIRTNSLTALSMEINASGNKNLTLASANLAGLDADTSKRVDVFNEAQKGNIEVYGGSYEARQEATYNKQVEKFREANASTGAVYGIDIKGSQVEGDITIGDAVNGNSVRIVATSKAEVSGYSENNSSNDGNYSQIGTKHTTAKAGEAIGIKAANSNGNINITVGDITVESSAISNNMSGKGEANITSDNAIGIQAFFRKGQITSLQGGTTGIELNKTSGNINIVSNGNIIARSIAQGGGGYSMERNNTTGLPIESSPNNYEYTLTMGDAIGIVASTVVDAASTTDYYNQDGNITTGSNRTGAFNADYNEFNRAADIHITTAAGKKIYTEGNNSVAILAQTNLGSITIDNNSDIEVKGQSGFKKYEANNTTHLAENDYSNIDKVMTGINLQDGALEIDQLVAGIALKSAGGLVTFNNRGNIQVSNSVNKDWNAYRGVRADYNSSSASGGYINSNADKVHGVGVAAGIAIDAGSRHYVYQRFETSPNGEYNNYVNGSIFDGYKSDKNESSVTNVNGDWISQSRVALATTTSSDGTITFNINEENENDTRAFAQAQTIINSVVARQRGHEINNWGKITVDADIASGITINMGEVIGISGIKTSTDGQNSRYIKPKVLTSYVRNYGDIIVDGTLRATGIDLALSAGSAVLENTGKINVSLAASDTGRAAGILLQANQHAKNGSGYQLSDLAWADTDYRLEGSAYSSNGYKGTDLVLNNSGNIELGGAAKGGMAGIWIGGLEDNPYNDTTNHATRQQRFVTINSTGIISFANDNISSSGLQRNALRITGNNVAKVNQLGLRINENAAAFNAAKADSDKLIYIQNGDLHLGHYESVYGNFALNTGSTTSPADYYIKLSDGAADTTALADGVNPAKYNTHRYVNDAVIIIEPGNNFQFDADYDVSNLIGADIHGDGASGAPNSNGVEAGRVYGALAGVRTTSSLSMYEGYVYGDAVDGQNSNYANQKFGVRVNAAKSPGASVAAQSAAALTAQGFKASNILGSVLASISSGSIGYSNIASLSQGYFEGANEYLASAGNVRTDASLEGLELYAANGSLAPVANTNGFIGFLVPYYTTTSVGGDAASSGNMFGIVGGLSKEFADGSLIGFHMGVESGSYDTDDNVTSTDALSGLFGVHGRYNLGLWNSYVRGELNIFFSSYDYDVSIDGSSSGDSSNSFGYGVGLYYGADFDLGGFGVLNPEIGLIYQGFSQEEMKINGSAIALNNHNYDFDNLNDLYIQAALRYTYAYEMGGGSAIVPTVLLGVRQLLTDDKYNTTVTLAGGQSFGGEISRDSTTFITEIGVAYQLSETFSLSLNYNGEFGDNVDTHSGFLKFVGRF